MDDFGAGMSAGFLIGLITATIVFLNANETPVEAPMVLYCLERGSDLYSYDAWEFTCEDLATFPMRVLPEPSKQN